MLKTNARYSRLVGTAQGAHRLHMHITELNDARQGWGYQHAHAAEEAIYMLEGEGEFRFDGNTHRVGPGDAVFFPSGVMHAETTFFTDRVKYLVVRTIEPGDEPCCCLVETA